MEDSSIEHLDFERWEDPTYTLRQDEMQLSLEILNNSTVARSEGTIYVMFPQDALGAHMLEAHTIPMATFTDTVSGTEVLGSVIDVMCIADRQRVSL